MLGSRLGKWRLEKEVGRGGMGRVYLALNEKPTRGDAEQAAVKVLSAELAQHSGFLERFDREIEALRKLDHPNIVRLYESGQFQGNYYYVMEFVDGVSLSDLIKEQGQLPWEVVAGMGVEICSALRHAHDHGIIHRDIKLSNLLVSNTGVVKLADFGVARLFNYDRLTSTHAVVGTADYMSPEQALGKPVTRRSDLYSLGVVLYYLVTGRPLFKAANSAEMMRKHCYGSFDSPSRIATDCPEELNHLICELLEKEPEKRPNDALAVMRRLERIRGKGSGRKWSSAMRSDEQPTMVDLGATPEPRVDREAPGLKPKRISLGSDDYERYTVPWWNRTWALAIGLLLAVSLAVYGLWPKSAEAIFRQAETAAAEESWGNVLVELDRLQGRTMDSDLQQRVDALRQQAQSEISAKRRPSGIGGLPQSEAERCYRDALQDYHAGRVEKARSKWQAILDAFQGIPAHEPWLRLARQALNQTETEKKEAEAIEEVIQRANKESKPERTRRLEALLELYRERQDEAGRLLLARIQRELKDS